MTEQNLLYKLGDVVEVMDLGYPCEITYIVADEEFDYEITAINDKTKVHFITENCINHKIGSNGWIDVNERMPTPFETVLVYCHRTNRQGITKQYILTSQYDTSLDGFEPYERFGTSSFVTHWQPLPKPPTK